MASCLTDVNYRSMRAKSSTDAEETWISDQVSGPHPSTRKRAHKANRGEERKLFLSRATRYLRKTLSITSTVFMWPALADFLFQFTHVHNDGRSLAGGVHALVSLIQSPLERIIGFDACYQFQTSNVDFMPLIIFVVLFIFRNRANAWLTKAESRIRGEKENPAQVRSSDSVSPSILGSNSPLRRVRKPGGDEHLTLRTKVMALYSE